MKELAAQLQRQQDAINSLTVAEYKSARLSFKAMKRNPAAAAAQESARKKFGLDVQASIKESLQAGGMGAAQAKAEAAKRAEKVMSDLASLHDPDMVAGGWMHPNASGMGRSDVNSSIGGSWNQSDRIASMDRIADEAIASGNGGEKMNIKLEPCRGNGLR